MNPRGKITTVRHSRLRSTAYVAESDWLAEQARLNLFLWNAQNAVSQWTCPTCGRPYHTQFPAEALSPLSNALGGLASARAHTSMQTGA